MPLIAEKLPRAVFYVVGAGPPAGFLAGMPGVVVTGRVPDVRPFLAHADVVVAPLFVARGVQNKVLEAMAMRRPVVANGAAVRALDVTPGRELLVAGDAASFAEAVLQAAQPRQARQLGMEGRLYVERHHDWNRSLKRFDELLEVLSHEAAATARPWESRPSFPVLEAP
jgi:glycosyltransferase involved in cell wall biosynthesis